MNPDRPTFATVGAVNHGKSSVVSTLAEDDQVRVSPRQGETVECKRFSLRDLFIFDDTPGFQNAPDVLAELQTAERGDDLLQFFREFIARHNGDPAFDAECRLFTPIVDGAGILYVVDGSRPLLPINRIEMKILSETGQPRLAIINLTGTDKHAQEWRRQLGISFNNDVREFNAHQASFDDRIELLEALAKLKQAWKPKLEEAITILREDWEIRLSDCAEIIVELLIECLTHEETRLLDSDDEARRKRLDRELCEKFQNWISEREAKAHQAILELFQHRLVTAKPTADVLFDESLFSDMTWRLCGCTEKQLIALGAVSGAVIGAGGDLLLGGHSLGAFAVGGAVIGAGGAFVTGKRRPEIGIELPRKLRFFASKQKVAGTTLRVGPYAAVGFPWILIDRAVAVHYYATHRAHARRDVVILNLAAETERMAQAGVSTKKWGEIIRLKCQQYFVAIRKHKLTPKGLKQLRELIRTQLVEVAKDRKT